MRRCVSASMSMLMGCLPYTMLPSRLWKARGVQVAPPGDRPGGLSYLEPDHSDQQGGHRSADQWADHRDRGVAPVGGAFLRNRQNGVHDPRTQIARGIDIGRASCRERV